MKVRPIDANALLEELQWMKEQAGSANSGEYNEMIYRVRKQPVLSLNTLRDEIYQDAVAHGLWEDVEKEARKLSEEEQPSERERWYTFHRRVCAANLVFCEGDELFSAADGEDWDGLQEELADVVIQAFSTTGYLGIDIDAAIKRKMEINKNRPWKHGK